MLKEFKEFAMRGNVLDMAVGIIIGAAFGRIVTSLVNDVLMPPIGLLMGKVDFSSLFWNLSGSVYPSLAEAKKAGAPVIGYGVFLNTILDFVVVALVIFLLIKQVNRFKKEPAPAAQTRRTARTACRRFRSRRPAAATAHPSCRPRNPASSGTEALRRRSAGRIPTIRRRGGRACRASSLGSRPPVRRFRGRPVRFERFGSGPRASAPGRLGVRRGRALKPLAWVRRILLDYLPVGSCLTPRV